MRACDIYISPAALFHYGIKGMKWGIRRNRKELTLARKTLAENLGSDIINLKTSTGLVIKRISSHQIDRAEERGITKRSIIDALTSPFEVKPIKLDEQSRPSQRYIGRETTVSVNPDEGTLITTWKTSSQIRRKYERMGK